MPMRCIAGPGVAVVPVATAAHLFGQRGRRGGDGRARRGVREQSKGHEAAHHRVSVFGHLHAGDPTAPAGLVARELARRHGGRHDDERSASGGGDDDRDGRARTHLELDASIRHDRGPVGGDGDREVAALAHERTRPQADAPRPPGARTRSEAQGGAAHVPVAPRALSRRTSTVPGRNRPSTSATRASESSSSPPSRLQVVVSVAVSGRYDATDDVSRFIGASVNQPASSPPTSRPNSGGSSKRGTHHQSIEPSGATSAAERVSPMRP